MGDHKEKEEGGGAAALGLPGHDSQRGGTIGCGSGLAADTLTAKACK